MKWLCYLHGMRSYFGLALISCIALAGRAQDTVYLEKAWKSDSVHHYGREALYTDAVAKGLYEGSLSREGWKEVDADAAHAFHTRGFGNNSYLYFTYMSPKATTALLHVKGSGGLFFNGAPHAGDAYGSGWLYIPVKVKKGLNELYLRPAGATTVQLIFSGPPLALQTGDPTLPSLRLGVDSGVYGAVVITNKTDRQVNGLVMRAELGGRIVETVLPAIPAMAIRKVAFRVDSRDLTDKGRYGCGIALVQRGRTVDRARVEFEAVEAGSRYNVTFFSHIDSSLQYYAVTPQHPDPSPGAALFLSVHGAGVEASGQAAAYESKNWGTLVAATNRRPRGFNWEDWGRLDALEVLSLAKAQFQPDPQHIYLTGHSMGGHGTWYLGATYPDHWAAIGACSGYPTLREYGSHDGTIPESGQTELERSLLRASNPSDVLKLASNYAPLGVYILHGDADPVVSVKYARQMRQVLGAFHTDFSYYEYPGGEHWFGNQSVDWKPLFQFFQSHQLLADSAVNHIDFITANPGISASFRWASIIQQQHPLDYSHIQLSRDLKGHKISGKTDNISMLALDLSGFENGKQIAIRIDSQETVNHMKAAIGDTVYLRRKNGRWEESPRYTEEEKNPARNGTFKEPFDHHMIFVYGTGGSREEQGWAEAKARYDAETWYYRGNGAVEIMSDKSYSHEANKGRSVIIYGNATTNSAWAKLLINCPIRVSQGELKAGERVFKGDDLGAYFTYPMANDSVSVGVIAGTGLKGMQAANANQYFAGGSGFPDFMIFRLKMLSAGAAGVEMAGSFDNEWKLPVQ